MLYAHEFGQRGRRPCNVQFEYSFHCNIRQYVSCHVTSRGLRGCCHFVMALLKANRKVSRIDNRPRAGNNQQSENDSPFICCALGAARPAQDWLTST